MSYLTSFLRPGRAGARATNLRLETLEGRALPSGTDWLVRFEGLPGDTVAEQMDAARERLEAARIEEDSVEVVDHAGPDGFIVVETPDDKPLEILTQELQGVPGFVDAQPFSPEDEVKGGENGDGGMPEQPDEGPVLAGGANLNVGLTGNEPTIAVNPLNANNVVVAQYNNGAQTMRISLDGGATFPITRNGVLVPGQTFFQGDDSLAFDAQGRLFWSYLSGGTPSGPNVTVVQINPTTGAVIGSPVLVATSNLDKEWIAADKNPSSPFANNLYVIWNDFNLTNAPVRFARSTNQGATWTTLPGNLSGANEGFTWPSEITVAPNGDVWVAWHTNTIGNGSNGEIRMRRSTDGGLTFGPEIIPFPAGTADAQVNAGSAEYGPPVPPRINKLKSWLQGSLQPRILADPARPGNIYVVSVDDPDNVYDAAGDPSDIVLARSTDGGATWTRSTISHGAAGTIQIMPAAAIDAAGNITVTWYDSRGGATNASGDWLLDVYTTTSSDGGLTFSSDTRINDLSFDPDLGAPDRFAPNQVLRIGEYNGLASAGGNAYAVWTGNSGSGQQIVFTKFGLGFFVTGSTPAAGQLVTTAPTDFVIRLNSPVAAGSVQPSDLTVNGIPASTVGINPAGDTLTFHYFVSPVTVEGPQTMAIAAAAMARQSDGVPLQAFSAGFFYDPQPLTVTTTTPRFPGGVFTLPGPFTYDVTFNEPFNPASLQAADLALTGLPGAIVAGVTAINGNTTARFTIGGVTAEGALTATIAAGGLTDTSGNPGLAFSATYQVDIGTVAYPTPLAPKNPPGSLIYDPSASGLVNFAGDTDTFTLAIDGGQTVTVLVAPTAAGLRPTVTLFDPSGNIIGSATAAAPGQNALLQTAAAPATGTYRVAVSGASGTTGTYTAQVTLNAAVEAEGTLAGAGNDSRAAAQDLTSSFVTLQTAQASAGRAAVLGGNAVAAPTPITTFDFESGTAGFTINNTPPAGAAPGLWHLSTGRGSQAGHSAVQSFYYGQGEGVNGGGNYATGTQRNTGSITSPTMFIPAGANLTFNYVLQTEAGTTFDTATVLVSTNNFATFTTVASRSTNLPNSSTWRAVAPISLSAFAGQTVQIRFVFDTVDGFINTAEGWYVDDVQVTAPGSWTDYYAVPLGAGESATVGLKNLTGTGTAVALEDAAGTTLATGVAGSTNLDQVVSNFVAPAAGTYYVRVTGSAAATYSTVVTRGAAFDTEANDSFATAQPLAGTQGALGALSNSVATLTPVVPNANATAEGDFNNGFPFNNGFFNIPSMRYQQIYAASQFTGGGVIDKIRFRKDAGGANFSTGNIDVKINLSYSATSPTAPSTVFANNVGPGAVTVFDGLLNLSSTGTGSPNPFDIVIDVADLFNYNPAQGNLLVDIFMRNAPVTTFFDAVGTAQTVTSRIFSSGTVNDTVGQAFQSGLVTRFDFAPVVTSQEDWYTINVAGPANRLRLETGTPADGPGQFTNTLNPHLDLFDPSGTLVASGTPLADGRNESLLYQPLTAGAYRVRVTGEGVTSGEYFLTKNFAPVVTNLSIAPINENDTATLTGTLADPDGLDTHTVLIDWGPGEGTTTLTLPAGVTSFGAGHQYLDDNPSGTPADTYPVSVTVTDNHSASGTSSTSATVNNVAPSDVALNSGTIDENGTFTLSGSFADPGTRDTHTVLIDWGGAEGTTTLNLPAGVLTFTAAHQYLDDNPSGTFSDTYPVAVTVTDDDTGVGSGGATVVVNNVAPSAVVLNSGTVDENGTFTVNGTFADPGTLDTHTVLIDWGPGEGTTTLTLPAGALAFSASHQYLDDNPTGTPADDYPISATVTDDDTGSGSGAATVTVNNAAPSGVTLNSGTIDENGTFTLSGSFADPGTRDTHTVLIDWGPGETPTTLDLPAGVLTFTASHQYLDDNPTVTGSDTYTVNVTVTDDDTGTGAASTQVTVNNVDPVAAPVNAPIDPVPAGAPSPVNVSATFTDVGTLDTHRAVWSWGDGSTSDGTVTEAGGSGTATGSHFYSAAGVYTVTLTLTDDDGGVTHSASGFVVVYDPSAGFVTGGGWIDSPAGAYTPDPTLTGKASFGFVAKYKKGTTIPDGNTQFQFHVAGMNFQSTSYDWLVVGGPKAQYKGVGTINGTGDYGFLLSAIDGQRPGGGGADKFRIKIWDRSTGLVIYDNQLGSSDTSDPTTLLGGGSIQIQDNSQ